MESLGSFYQSLALIAIIAGPIAGFVWWKLLGKK